MRRTTWNSLAYIILGITLAIAPGASRALAQAASATEESSLSRLTRDELAIWNDSSFRKRFADSYLAESEIEPRVTVEERDQLQKVLNLISSDNMDKAAQMLKKEIARNEAVSPVFYFTLANIHFQSEQMDPAAEAYRIAVERYPKFRRAWKNLGLIYVRQGQFQEALSALTKVVELGGNDAITYGLLGFAYASRGDYLSAESAYRMAILLDPGTMDWKMGLARSFFKQERYSEAAAICGNLLADQPERADLWLLQANAFIGLNQPLKAAENYEVVERLGQSTRDSLNMLGDIYLNEGLYAGAVDAYIRALEKEGQDHTKRLIRSARILIAKGAIVETRSLISKIEETQETHLPDDERKDLLKLQARLAVADGKGEEEAKVLEEIVALDPLDGEALILLGQHCSRAGNTEKAIFYYERAESLEKFEADAKVRHAQLLVGSGKYEEALPLLRRAQQIDPRENVQKYLEQVERVARVQ